MILPTDPQNDDAPLTGHLDDVDWRYFAGWAFNPTQPDESVWLELLVDDEPPVPFLANLLRQDLAQAGIGTGRYGFHFHFSRALDTSAPHTVRVRRASDGRDLQNSPWMLPQAPAGNAEARARFEASFAAEIEAARAGDELLPLTKFLLTQTDRLLQAACDTDSGRRRHLLYRKRWAETLGGEPMQVDQPDWRSSALFVGVDLPATPAARAMLGSMQALGLRVAVVAMRGLVSEGETAEALRAQGVVVHGTPLFGSVEDVLRRHAPDFRLVVLEGPLAAAAYGMASRLHHPRARTLAWLEDPAFDPTAGVAGQLVCDAVITGTGAAAREFSRRVQGRAVFVMPMQDENAVRDAALATAAAITRPAPPDPA